MKGTYRHFKGGLYEVLCCGRNSEDLTIEVVYKSLEDGKIWIRPLSMFFSLVEGKEDTKRFERVK